MAIVDFIVSNYITILIIVLILIFALIGRYVEKKGILAQAPEEKNKKTKEELMKQAENNFSGQYINDNTIPNNNVNNNINPMVPPTQNVSDVQPSINEPIINNQLPVNNPNNTIQNDSNTLNQLPVENINAIDSLPKVEQIQVPIEPEQAKIVIEDIDEALFSPMESNEVYDELDKEVKNLLPKKEVIDDDLLSDIDNLSLDKTQKYNFKDIPDLDDVDLPKIKKNKSKEDIWKF